MILKTSLVSKRLPYLTFFYSKARLSQQSIIVPTRIERSPTDVLRALAGTVKTDYTAPHYRYHDDPWLIPYRNNTKKEFALSKEAGKKAARYILDKHPELFDQNRITAEPPITAFQPRASYNHDNVTLELLDNLIQSFQVTDSIQVFNLLEEKGKLIPAETKQDLLELVSYHNEEEIDEEGGDSPVLFSNTPQKKWNVGGFADHLYSKEAESSTAGTKVAMLVGLGRFDKERAAQMLAECRANNVSFPVEGYNTAIKCSKEEGVEGFMTEVKEILKEMKQKEVAPSTETLISVLSGLRMFTIKEYSQCCSYALDVLAEFRQAKVSLSLGVYKLLLQIYYNEKKKTGASHLLLDLMDELEGRDMWPASSLEDLDFLPHVMIVANQMNNVNLARKINEFLLTGRNINFLTSLQLENTYYMNFLTVVLQNDSFDNSMELYNQITPHLWSPNSGFYKNMLNSLHSNQGMNHMAKVFDDIILSDYGGSNREGQYEINYQVLQILQSNDPSVSEYLGLSEVWVDIASRIYKHLNENKASKILYLRFNNLAASICNLSLSVLVREASYEKVVEVFNFCVEEKSVMPGCLSDGVLTDLFNFCHSLGETEKAVQVVEYMVDVGSGQAISMAELLTDLSIDQNKYLNKLFLNDPGWVPK